MTTKKTGTFLGMPYDWRRPSLQRIRDEVFDIDEIKAGRDIESARADLRARFGAGTFPQIVIGDRHVGGADQLVALDKSGELDQLLRA